MAEILIPTDVLFGPPPNRVDHHIPGCMQPIMTLVFRDRKNRTDAIGKVRRMAVRVHCWSENKDDEGFEYLYLSFRPLRSEKHGSFGAARFYWDPTQQGRNLYDAVVHTGYDSWRKWGLRRIEHGDHEDK